MGDEVLDAMDDALGPLPAGIPRDQVEDIRARRAGDPDIDALLSQLDRFYATIERIDLLSAPYPHPNDPPA